MTKKPAQKKISLSQAFVALEKITAEFERGEVDLEKGIPKLKRGLVLARYLKKRLMKIENEIEEVKAEFEDLDKQGGIKRGEEDPEIDEPQNIPF